MIPVRWKVGEPRESRTFDQIAPEHPISGWDCPACEDVLGNGQPVTLLILGPGSDLEHQNKHREGHWYAAQSIPVHQACLGGTDG